MCGWSQRKICQIFSVSAKQLIPLLLSNLDGNIWTGGRPVEERHVLATSEQLCSWRLSREVKAWRKPSERPADRCTDTVASLSEGSVTLWAAPSSLRRKEQAASSSLFFFMTLQPNPPYPNSSSNSSNQLRHHTFQHF